MRKTILALSGRKGSGKNTLAQFITQYYKTHYEDSVFECSFADTLKEFCIETLGLSYEQCYGTNEQKNSFTHYNWENFEPYFRWKFGSKKLKNYSTNETITLENSPKLRLQFYMKCFSEGWHPLDTKQGKVTAREILQLFGTEIIRETFGNVWAESTLRKILKKNCSLSIITDNRFPSEIDAILKEENGYIIRLTRSPYGQADTHDSEASLDNFDWSIDKCFLLDNSDLTVSEQNERVIPVLEKICNGV